MDLETKFYELQDRYQTLINDYEQLRDSVTGNTWVGLTDEEQEEIALEVPMDAVLITEAKLKEKNTNS